MPFLTLKNFIENVESTSVQLVFSTQRKLIDIKHYLNYLHIFGQDILDT